MTKVRGDVVLVMMGSWCITMTMNICVKLQWWSCVNASLLTASTACMQRAAVWCHFLGHWERVAWNPQQRHGRLQSHPVSIMMMIDTRNIMISYTMSMILLWVGKLYYLPTSDKLLMCQFHCSSQGRNKDTPVVAWSSDPTKKAACLDAGSHFMLWPRALSKHLHDVVIIIMVLRKNVNNGLESTYNASTTFLFSGISQLLVAPFSKDQFMEVYSTWSTKRVCSVSKLMPILWNDQRRLRYIQWSRKVAVCCQSSIWRSWHRFHFWLPS